MEDGKIHARELLEFEHEENVKKAREIVSRAIAELKELDIRMVALYGMHVLPKDGDQHAMQIAYHATPLHPNERHLFSQSMRMLAHKLDPDT